jgi:hypothetical protein
MQHALIQRINGLLANAYGENESDADYQDTFANEGIRKAEYIVDDLKYRESKGLVQLESLGYFCIGGADGSEVEYVLSETAISKAVMIEYSAEGVAAASKRASDLGQHGKEFVVLQGDATSLLDDALAVIEKWQASGAVDGLVCSAQGVLHELPSRSPGFDLPIFLGKVFRNPSWRACAFYSREPSLPEGWPQNVRIRIPGLPASQLVRFARYVCDRLSMQGSPQALGSDWVDLPSPRAIETLHQLIRDGSMRRIGYELEEQLTGFSPIAVKAHLQSLVDGMHVTVEHVTTSGFKAALRDYRVEYVGHHSESLPVPKTHSEIIGFMCTGPTQAAPAPTFRVERPHATKAEVQFKNPFGRKVSDGEIVEWLSLFEPDERPLVARLLEGFVYLSFERVRSMAVELHAILNAQLRDTMHRAWFVPMGGVARSGAYVAYVFRSVNQIPNERFVPHELLRSRMENGDPVVLLDDLLASGHQAAHEWSALRKSGKIPMNSPVYLATLVSCEAGRTFVEERTTLESVSALQLLRSQEPLSSDSTLFPEMVEREKVRRLLEKYGRVLSPRGPLGYAGSGLLLAFEHSTPDNSLPIFWAATNGWKPLLAKGSPPRMGTAPEVAQADEPVTRSDA